MTQVSAATKNGDEFGTATTFSVPINFAHLRRYTLGDSALEKEILDLFAAQLPITIDHLRQASDAEGWKRAAHTLKGSAKAVGADHLAELATAAEQMMRLADTSQRGAFVTRIDAAAADITDFIATL